MVKSAAYRMLPQERRRALQSLLLTNPTVSNKELARFLDCSESVIRRLKSSIQVR
jgi:DeoR/GlpR family transcriptional regulator of sugar metabolism